MNFTTLIIAATLSWITPEITFTDLVKASNQFAEEICPFPTEDNRIAHLVAIGYATEEEVVEHAKTTHPILHPQTITLINSFLNYKRQFGSPKEKKLYAEMDQNAFIDRLLTKRPLSFWAAKDNALLRNGENVTGNFQAIGTENEKPPLILKDYLSYDEMQVSALLGVSVPTYFINKGDRKNLGIMGKPGTFEKKGIYIGQAGPRLEIDVMEWQHMVITPKQNTPQNGYGPSNQPTLLKLWAAFYGLDHFPTYEEALKDKSGRYIQAQTGVLLDKVILKKRMRLVIEPFLADANARAAEKGKKAYVRATGLGLGVWALNRDLQMPLLIDAYADVLAEKTYPHITDIDFNWFAKDKSEAQALSCGGAKDQQILRTSGNQIKIHFTWDGQAEKMQGKDGGKLLVSQYAWDSNSFPGNEYWEGLLDASGDPAAACCSTIAELQNPCINPYVIPYRSQH